MKKLFYIIFILVSVQTIIAQGNGLYKFQDKNGKYGFMDKNGIIKIKPTYLIVDDFSEGLCYVSKEVIKKGYKWIFIDTLGNEAFDIDDHFPETKFSNGFARIESSEGHYFVNRKGINEFGKTWKDGYGAFKKGIAYVSDKQFTDFYPINTKGERVDHKTYSRLEIYESRENDSSTVKHPSKYQSDNFIPFKKKKLWGFKDSHGKIVIPAQFYKIDEFKNGVCGVQVHEPFFKIANDYYLDIGGKTKCT